MWSKEILLPPFSPRHRDQPGRFRGSGSCWLEAKKEFIIGMCSLWRSSPSWLLELAGLLLPGLLGSCDTITTTMRLWEPPWEMWFNDGVKCNILGLGVAGRLLICLNVCCHHEEQPRAGHCHHHNLSWPPSLPWLAVTEPNITEIQQLQLQLFLPEHFVQFYHLKNSTFAQSARKRRFGIILSTLSPSEADWATVRPREILQSSLGYCWAWGG